jgi:lia operon protein LiaF
MLLEEWNMQGKSFGGIVLIVVGVLFLAHQLGWIDVSIGYLFRTYWPVILIVIGATGLLSQQRYYSGGFGTNVWNLILIGVGVVFLNNNLQLFDWRFDFGDIIQFFIPAFIIILGLRMLFRPNDADERKYEAREACRAAQEARRAERRGHRQQNNEHHQEHYRHWNGSGNSAINRSNFIGDIHIGQEQWELQPMNVSHFIGDTEIDLTKAFISYGETKLNISSFIGDVKIYVPNDVELEVQVTASSFIGDIRAFERYEGGMLKNMVYATPTYPDAGKRIKLIISLFIGDIKVMRVG